MSTCLEPPGKWYVAGRERARRCRRGRDLRSHGRGRASSARPLGHARRSCARAGAQAVGSVAPPARGIDRHQQGRPPRLRGRRRISGAHGSGAGGSAPVERAVDRAATSANRRRVPDAGADGPGWLRARELCATPAAGPPRRASRRGGNPRALPAWKAGAFVDGYFNPRGRLARERTRSSRSPGRKPRAPVPVSPRATDVRPARRARLTRGRRPDTGRAT